MFSFFYKSNNFIKLTSKIEPKVTIWNPAKENHYLANERNSLPKIIHRFRKQIQIGIFVVIREDQLAGGVFFNIESEIK